MTPDLEGKVALLTAGAGAGIGQAIGRALAEAGATVVLTDRAADRTVAVADKIATDTGALVVPMTLDVTDEARIAEVVDEVAQDYGPVDILVNNSGLTRPAPIWEMSTEVWREVHDVCLTSQFWLMRAVLPSMIERRSGTIVNLASSYAWMGTNTGEAHYISAKAGVMGLTRAAAAEVGPYGIRVNAIAPGMIYNEFLKKHYDDAFFERIKDQTPLGRAGRPEDIANTVLYLVSPASSFITGEIICASGGWYMHA